MPWYGVSLERTTKVLILFGIARGPGSHVPAGTSPGCSRPSRRRCCRGSGDLEQVSSECVWIPLLALFPSLLQVRRQCQALPGNQAFRGAETGLPARASTPPHTLAHAYM